MKTENPLSSGYLHLLPSEEYVDNAQSKLENPAMLRATGYPLLFLAMFSIAGGHWAVLQSVAWTGMLIEYSQSASIGTAIIKTFGGKAPCQMCRTVEEGRQKENKLPATVKTDKKIDKFLVRPVRAVPLPPATDFFYPPISDEVASARPAPPSAPVPIAA